MYHRFKTTALLAALLSLSAMSASAEEFHATFSGFNEVGAILSEGKATLKLSLDRASQTVTFWLNFSGLSSPVTQSHIHFGKVHTSGSVMVFFCSSLATAPAGVQPCPADGGTVTGTIMASNVLAVATQNIKAGDFDALTDALNSDTAYANIHTTNFPAGEIRGQIHSRDHRED